jgi:hypothetical protein
MGHGIHWLKEDGTLPLETKALRPVYVSTTRPAIKRLAENSEGLRAASTAGADPVCLRLRQL